MRASTALITQDGSIITSSADFPFKEDIQEYLQQNTAEFGMSKISKDKQNYLIHSERSTFGEWDYITAFPSQMMLEELAVSRMMTLIMMSLLLLIFIIIIIFLRRKSITPVRQLMTNIASSTGKEGFEQGNEIQLIHVTLERLRQEQEQIQHSLQTQHPMIYNNVLTSLLQEVPVGESVQRKKEMIDLSFAHQGFLVLTLEVVESSSGDFLHKKEERALLKAVIINIAEDLFRSIGDLYPVEVSWEELGFILNSSLPESVLEERAAVGAGELLGLLESLFTMRATVGISEYGTSAERLHSQYQMAQDAKARKILTGVHTVNRYTEDQSMQGEYFYPTYMEHKLIDSVATGDGEEALRIIEVVFQKNFEDSNLPIAYVQCLFYDILATGLKLLSELRADPTEVFGQDDLEEELLQSRTVEEARETIVRIISLISQYVNDTLENKKEPLLLNIIQHIEENYQSNDTCIASIAKAVEITESYLCHYFKEQTGTTVMRYVEQLRLKKVKEKLLGTERTLSEIAEQTGFSNSSVLIRTFKRRIGVTPNQYRNDRMSFGVPENISEK